jgi:hypothetical protein
MSNDDQEAANRHVDAWARDKPHFSKVRQRMGEIISTDHDLLRSGKMGLGTIRDGNIDLDHAYDLATRMHPETLSEIRAAKKQQERNTKPQREDNLKSQRRGGEPEKARDTILRSVRELKERD